MGPGNFIVDRSSKDEQLLIRPLFQKIKNMNMAGS
jgi:hypothetical protein